jgi:hypothetical protein
MWRIPGTYPGRVGASLLCVRVLRMCNRERAAGKQKVRVNPCTEYYILWAPQKCRLGYRQPQGFHTGKDYPIRGYNLIRTKRATYVIREFHGKAAEGFISGKRPYGLKVARETEAKALAAIAEWAEGHARYALANWVIQPPS